VSDETPWDAGEFAPSGQIAGYRLEEQIGRGGMAVVYRAHDARLDRPVALKVLAPELARDQEFRQRFIRESRAAAAVDHPNIIPVFEAGEANGVLFIAMRYVTGHDLRTLLQREGPLGAARVTTFIAQIASALDMAHSRGLVHRDVKPANMLLDAPAAGGGGADHVYLSDFGLSKQSLAPADLTSAGQFLGTLDYVAPEQIEGRPVDGRADLYALACAAYEMLCGSPPFERDQRMAVLWAQLSEPPPTLTSRRPDLPQAVNEVMAKALAKSPEDRYPRCSEFAAALRSACAVADADAPFGGPARAPGSAGVTAGGPGGTEVAGRAPAGTNAADAGSPGGVAAAAAGGAGAADAGAAGAAGPERTEVAAAGSGTGSAGPGAAGPGGAGPGAAGPGAAGPGGAGPGGHGGTEIAGSRGTGASAADFGGGWIAAGGRPQSPGPGAGRDKGDKGTGRETEAASPAAPFGGAPSERPPSPPPLVTTPGEGEPARRPWLRSRAALITACVAVVAIAGAAFAIRAVGTGSGDGGGALTAPGCTKAVATAKTLPKVGQSSVALPGKPFAVAVTPDNQWTFVTLGKSVAVLQNGASLAPALVRTIAVPAPKGEALTHDGRYLLVATGSGARVIDAVRAEQGSPDTVVGTLASRAGTGAVQVTVSPDDRFAFVTLEKSRAMVVFNLRKALASGFGPADVVGSVRLGVQPTGLRVSSDGRWLYVTSQMRKPGSGEGTLSVLDLRRAETRPATSVKATVTAGCSPVRAISSDDASVVWVTARDSNAVLAFSAAKLVHDPAHALMAWLKVGAAPIGLTFVNRGKRIVVADSNLFGSKSANANLAVIDTSAALAGRPALLGLLKTGDVPRQFTVEPHSKTLFVTNYGSGQLQAVAIADLP